MRRESVFDSFESRESLPGSRGALDSGARAADSVLNADAPALSGRTRITRLSTTLLSVRVAAAVRACLQRVAPCFWVGLMACSRSSASLHAAVARGRACRNRLGRRDFCDGTGRACRDRVGRAARRQVGPHGQRPRAFQSATPWRTAKNAAGRVAGSDVVVGRGDLLRGGRGREGVGALIGARGMGGFCPHRMRLGGGGAAVRPSSGQRCRGYCRHSSLRIAG